MKPDFSKAWKLEAISGSAALIGVLSFSGGCATERIAHQGSAETVPTSAENGGGATKYVETRYDVRGYREAGHPAVRHEAHVVYRSTRVVAAASEDTVANLQPTYRDVSYAPLLPSEELAAELATQKTITANLRELQTSIAEAERRLEVQYATLVQESAAVLRVREQLDAERDRARVAVPSATNAAPAVTPAEVKW